MENEKTDAIDEIVSLILRESRDVKNPSAISRIFHVHMQVTIRLMLMMEAIREEEDK